MTDFFALPPFKRWYRFGWKSPRIMVARFRNKHQFWFRLRMAWQRVTRTYADDQFWSLSHSLAIHTVLGVQHLRKWKNGYPVEFTTAYGNGKEWEGWDAVLAQIEEGFQAWLDTDGWFYEYPDLEKKFKVAMRLYAKWFNGLWD